jgi:hypothetical protein
MGYYNRNAFAFETLKNNSCGFRLGELVGALYGVAYTTLGVEKDVDN